MHFSTSFLWLVAATTTVLLSTTSAIHEAATADDSVTMYVGGYTRNEGWVNGQSKGVYAFTFFPGNGTLREKSVTAAGINPTFLRGTKVASAGKKQFLYATNECAEASKDVPGTTTGYVVAMEVTSTGLKVLNQRETRGSQPAHVSVNPSENFVAISMYGGGGVIMYPIEKDGSLDVPSDSHFYSGGSKVGASQDAAHLHSTTWVSGSDVVFAADLGNDQIVQYTLNASTKKLVNTTLPIIKRPPGSGPRHMALHPSGEIAYVVDEISNTIGVYQLNSDKSLPKNVAQTVSTLPSGYTQASSSADIHVSDDGNFVYSSNRGHNSIAIFKVVSQTTGTLQLVGIESSRGDSPRSFVVYKNFLIVANMNSNNIAVFRRNADGTLTYTGNSVSNPTPSSLFIPAV